MPVDVLLLPVCVAFPWQRLLGGLSLAAFPWERTRTFINRHQYQATFSAQAQSKSRE